MALRELMSDTAWRRAEMQVATWELLRIDVRLNRLEVLLRQMLPPECVAPSSGMGIPASCRVEPRHRPC